MYYSSPSELAQLAELIAEKIAAYLPRRPSPPRVGLTIAESAEALGMSESSFKRYVLPEIRVCRVGSLRIIPIPALADWVERNASLAGVSHRS
jgi:AraC-like DNA-binding protein